LAPIDRQHPQIVALMRGPQVLFPLGENIPMFTSGELLQGSEQGGAWQVNSSSGKVTFVPFTEIGDERYSTYVRLRSN
jgi:hypothetical protein